MNEVTLKVFSPRAEVESVPQVSSSARLGDLTGKKIGILNNGKSGGDSRILRRRYCPNG